MYSSENLRAGYLSYAVFVKLLKNKNLCPMISTRKKLMNTISTEN